jgi:ribosomal-protein-serine acetyltransferase
MEPSLKNFADTGSCDLMIKKQKDICVVIGINRIDELNKTAVLGYWIDKDYEGMGIIRESCKTLISYCFDFLNLYRVEIHCSVENHRSIAIPYSLGFTHEGTFRKAMLVHEEKQDAKIYGLLNSEWRRADV